MVPPTEAFTERLRNYFEFKALRHLRQSSSPVNLEWTICMIATWISLGIRTLCDCARTLWNQQDAQTRAHTKCNFLFLLFANLFCHFLFAFKLASCNRTGDWLIVIGRGNGCASVFVNSSTIRPALIRASRVRPTRAKETRARVSPRALLQAAYSDASSVRIAGFRLRSLRINSNRSSSLATCCGSASDRRCALCNSTPCEPSVTEHHWDCVSHAGRYEQLY